MTKTVLGKDLMLFVDGKTLALATSCKLGLSAETIDTQSKDSGIWTEKSVKKLSWNCSSENLFSADADINGYDKLFGMMIARTAIPIVFGIPANAESDELPSTGWSIPSGKSYSGKVIVTGLDLNAPDGDKATFSATFEGTGALKPIAATVKAKSE